jgi:hypothetical protein
MNTYLAFTPYHLILVGALQLAADDPPARVCYADEAGFLERYPEVAEALPNMEWTFLRTTDQSSRISLPVKSQLNARAIVNSVRISAQHDGTVYVFNGTRPDVLRAAEVTRDRATFEYVEDGLDAYLPLNVEEEIVTGYRFRRHTARLLFGYWNPVRWDMVSTLPFSAYNVLFPELARINTEGSGLALRQIDGDCFARSVARFSDTVRDVLPDCRATDVHFLPISKGMGDWARYLANLDTRIEQLREQITDARPAVKAHPREGNESFLEGLRRLRAVNLPHWIPAEMLLGCLSSPCRITCGVSTFVMTSKKLIPTRQIRIEGSLDDASCAFFREWDPTIEIAAT